MERPGQRCLLLEAKQTWPGLHSVSRNPRDACVSRILSLQLQKSPPPNLEEKCGNSPDISKGVSRMGMCKFESSQGGQAVPRLEASSLKVQKSPLLAGFCNSVSVSKRPSRRTGGPFRQKSPATIANIPVFRRLSLETRFDLHCVRGTASISLASPAGNVLDWESYRRTAKRPYQETDRARSARLPKPAFSGRPRWHLSRALGFPRMKGETKSIFVD